MITTTILPPEIVQHFNSILLSSPLPGIKEGKYYDYLYELAKKKYIPNSRKMRDFEQLLELNEILYGWKKAKEAYDKTETKEISQRPLIPFGKINKCRGLLGKELRRAFFSYQNAI